MPKGCYAHPKQRPRPAPGLSGNSITKLPPRRVNDIWTCDVIAVRLADGSVPDDNWQSLRLELPESTASARTVELDRMYHASVASQGVFFGPRGLGTFSRVARAGRR